jgi:hypothetical protein
MKRVVVLVFFAMVVIGSCAPQSANNDAQRIVGTWVSEDGQTTHVFNANGTGTWKGITISYGISAVGKICLSSSEYALNSSGGSVLIYDLYFSPDGRRMILDGKVFQKK